MNKILLILIGIIVLVIISVLAISFLTNHRQSQSLEVDSLTTVAQQPEDNLPEIENFNVPILMYHYIRVAPEGDELGQRLSVVPENFEKQVLWLKDNDYESLKVEDLADPEKIALRKIYAVNKKPVVLTFDDAYDDSYTEAFKILKKYDFTGTVFVIRNFVGRPQYATEAQIAEMAEYGLEIGSHSLSHLDLAKLDETAAQEQIIDSKEMAKTFCYPAGKYNEKTIEIVKSAGYIAAVTTKNGIANQDSDLFELPRLRIMDTGLEIFAQKVKGIE